MFHLPPLILALVTAAFALSACAGRGYVPEDVEWLARMPAVKDTSVGRWEHRYPNNKRLVGVYIQQFPDSLEVLRYEGKHPCMVCYVFEDGRVRGFDYEPDGTVSSSSTGTPYVWMLEQLDIVYRPDTLKTLIERAKAQEQRAEMERTARRKR